MRRNIEGCRIVGAEIAMVLKPGFSVRNSEITSILWRHSARRLRTRAADVDHLDDDIAQDYLDILNFAVRARCELSQRHFANVMAHLNKHCLDIR